MDDIIQAVAIVLLLLAGGAGEFFKKMRKASQQKNSVPKQQPTRPASAKPQTDSYDAPSPSEKKEDDPITTVFRELFDMQDQEVVIVDEPPSPPKGERVDRPKQPNMFEQWDQQDRETIPPFRPEAYPQRPKQKPIQAAKPKPAPPKPKPKVPPPKVMQKKIAASEYLAGASAASSESQFQNLYDRFGDNPLKLAVIYNEILNRPRSLRNTSPRKYT